MIKGAALHHNGIIYNTNGINEKHLFVNRFFVQCTIFFNRPDALTMQRQSLSSVTCNDSGLHVTHFFGFQGISGDRM
jgi:uncharacterized membrane protein YcgQ (UPF0703/DUF1980 family)